MDSLLRICAQAFCASSWYSCMTGGVSGLRALSQALSVSVPADMCHMWLQTAAACRRRGHVVAPSATCCRLPQQAGGGGPL